MNTTPCPTCGHVHPDGIGISFCMCSDCNLMWTRRDRVQSLAPEYRERYDELWKEALG